MKKIEFTQEQINDILEKYYNNWSQQKIAYYYNVSRPTIKKILKNQENIILRKQTSKYIYKQDIFENIDNVEKAYWLGFIAADGCNYQRKQNASLIISIHQKDIEHLKKFKVFCQTNAKIKKFNQNQGYSNNTPMCKIVLNSKKISNDLIDKGIVPNKSLVLNKPNIDSKYFLPFILGYFDGDGSISKTNQYNNYSVSIQGTKELLEWIKKVLNLDAKLEKRCQDSKNSYYIRVGGTNKPYKILKTLYDSCEIHLDRKYNIYKTLETVVLNRNIE